jgi:hypothetical protein
MKWLAVVVGVVALALAGSVQPALVQAKSSASTFVMNDIQPISLPPVHVSCALGGAGEDVQLAGDQRVRVEAKSYRNGMYRTKVRIRYDVTGYGDVSYPLMGATYRARGDESTIEFGYAPLPVTLTYLNQYRLESRLLRTKLVAHVRNVQYIDLAGDVTVISDIYQLSCTSMLAK